MASPAKCILSATDRGLGGDLADDVRGTACGNGLVSATEVGLGEVESGEDIILLVGAVEPDEGILCEPK